MKKLVFTITLLLFAIATQPFNNLLSQNKYFEGVIINNNKECCSLYADDTTLYIANTQQLNNAIEVIKIYEQASGAQLNIDKCALILATTHHIENTHNIEIIHTDKTERLLVIQIGAFSQLNNH